MPLEPVLACRTVANVSPISRQASVLCALLVTVSSSNLGLKAL